MPDAAAPIAPSKLAHFALRTRRYEELIAWYQTVLGAKPVFASPFITFPEALLARWQAGASERELRAPSAGPSPSTNPFAAH